MPAVVATQEKFSPETLVETWVELNALDVLLTSGFALGRVFKKHLSVVLDEDGVNLDLDRDDVPDLQTAFAFTYPPHDDHTLQAKVAGARSDLLIARLLRSITPEVIEESASYFEGLAATQLEELSPRVAESVDV
jgi:hypothetical protein